MPLQSNVNVRVAYDTETTLGTQAPGTGHLMRRVSSSLALTKEAFTSNEVRPDQQVQDARHGVRRVSGNIQGELSRTTYDDFLAAALRTSWVSNKLTPGTTQRSFTIEQVYPELDVSEVFLGCRVSDVAISMPPTGMATINLGFQGLNMATYTGAGSPVYNGAAAVTQTSLLAGVNGSLSINGTQSAIITSLDFTIANNLNSTPVVGSNVVPEIFYGRLIVTGTLSAYFDSLTMLNYFLNETELGITARLTESNGSDWLQFAMGRVKLMGASKTVGPDGGVILQSPFQALYHDTAGTADDGSIIITRSA
jgi:hypothetical protein